MHAVKDHVILSIKDVLIIISSDTAMHVWREQRF